MYMSVLCLSMTVSLIIGVILRLSFICYYLIYYIHDGYI